MLSLPTWMIWLILASAVFAQKLQTLFNVDLTKDTDGGCQKHEAALEQQISDSSKLAAAGIAMMAAYNDERTAQGMIAKRTVDAFWYKPGDPEQVDIKGRFTKVQAFLDNKSPLNPKPWLFCDDSWLQAKTGTDAALNTKGMKYQKNGQVATIEAVYGNKIEECQKRTKKICYAYYADRFKQYIVDIKYGRAGTGYCSVPENIAVTQDIIQPNTITLCPKAFTEGTFALGTIDPQPVQETAVSRGTARGGQTLYAVRCQALTLFHELFHLVLGSQITPDPTYTKYYLLPYILKNLDTAQAVAFPESYALAAEAFWYTQNKKVNEQLVDYSSGACVFSPTQ